MATLKEMSQKPELFTGGHRMCAGCGAPMVVRTITKALDVPVVVSNATGCLEVSSGLFPFSAWRCSWIHVAFENAAAVLSGVEAAHKSLQRQGKVKEDFKFIAFGGDGGTYDIGFQSLSGAMERGHRMLYVCYDNEGYMNTGIQRSSATPRGADTTTSPAGKVIPGKVQHRKDLTGIMAAHGIPYVAQAAPAFWNDMHKKAEKALNCGGAAFMNTLAPCPRGWRSDPSDTVALTKIAVETCYWPLYEVENGEWRLTYRPKEKRPIEDFLKPQGRFAHLFKPENRHVIDELQAEVDRRWNALLKRCGEA